jgi:uncharacterized protein YfcZ (UPF0381/DUF406 family)
MTTLFEFQGDAWAADAVAGIMINPDDTEMVTIVLRNTDTESWINYSFDSEEEAQEKLAAGIQAWRAALENLSGPPPMS